MLEVIVSKASGKSSKEAAISSTFLGTFKLKPPEVTPAVVIYTAKLNGNSNNFSR